MNDKATTKHLFRAIMKGQYKPVKIIVDGGADIHTTNDSGQTPLMKAYLELKTSPKSTRNTPSARFKIFQYLLKHGADPSIEDRHGRSVANMEQLDILTASKSKSKVPYSGSVTHEYVDSRAEFSSFTTATIQLDIQHRRVNEDRGGKIRADEIKCLSQKHYVVEDVESNLGCSNTQEEVLTYHRVRKVSTITASFCELDISSPEGKQDECKNCVYQKRTSVVVINDIIFSLND